MLPHALHLFVTAKSLIGVQCCFPFDQTVIEFGVVYPVTCCNMLHFVRKLCCRERFNPRPDMNWRRLVHRLLILQMWRDKFSRFGYGVREFNKLMIVRALKSPRSSTPESEVPEVT